MAILALEPPPVTHPTVDFCGQWYCQFSWDSAASSGLAILVTMALVILVARRAEQGVPGWLQLALETLYGYVSGQQAHIDPDEAIIVPIGMTIFLYILVANWLDFLPLPGPFHPANSDLNQTLAMGILVFLLTQWYSFKVLGVRGYLYRMTRPFDAPLYVRIPFVLLNIIEDLAKPLTLSLRLFGNIFGGLIMLWVLTSLLPQISFPGVGTYPAQGLAILATVIWKLFDVGLIGAIQALIFMLLTIIYFEQAREGAEHLGHPHGSGAPRGVAHGNQSRPAAEGGNS
ncbi:MAG TPA: F0F1 ATP synthase subunit A [Candidatus Dormibacteraeota bacterium]|nr:F0F1 ATP synthase subunit A [Candidatus Dormibacteraeota bacterium]